MSNPTVYAVMKVTIEIPVRSASGGETMTELHDAAKSEAEGILRTKLPECFRVCGQVEFAYATIK